MRPIAWMGDSKKRIQGMPDDAQHDIGTALALAQWGKKATKAKPFKGVGSGIFEIAVRVDTNAYRLVYAVKIGDTIYVLHAFQKKSPSGIKTAQKDINLIKQRYREAVEQEKENECRNGNR